MLIAVFVALAFALTAHLVDATARAQHTAVEAAADHREARLRAYSAAVAAYRQRYLAYPATAAALAATPGFESTRGLLTAWQGYAVSGTLNDGTWRFLRAVAYSQDPHQALTDTDYLAAANNACGADAFSSATTWCAPNTGSQWWRDDLRAMYPSEITDQRAALVSSLAKFAAAYTANGAFPDPGATSISLTSAVGYGGTAAACRGTWLFAGVPLDCSDLFSRWGYPIRYHYTAATSIHLTARAPIFDAAGAAVRVSAHITLS